MTIVTEPAETIGAPGAASMRITLRITPYAPRQELAAWLQALGLEPLPKAQAPEGDEDTGHPESNGSAHLFGYHYWYSGVSVEEDQR